MKPQGYSFTLSLGVRLIPSSRSLLFRILGRILNNSLPPVAEEARHCQPCPIGRLSGSIQLKLVSSRVISCHLVLSRAISYRIVPGRGGCLSTSLGQEMDRRVREQGLHHACHGLEVHFWTPLLRSSFVPGCYPGRAGRWDRASAARLWGLFHATRGEGN